MCGFGGIAQQEQNKIPHEREQVRALFMSAPAVGSTCITIPKEAKNKPANLEPLMNPQLDPTTLSQVQRKDMASSSVVSRAFCSGSVATSPSLPRSMFMSAPAGESSITSDVNSDNGNGDDVSDSDEDGDTHSGNDVFSIRPLLPTPTQQTELQEPVRSHSDDNIKGMRMRWRMAFNAVDKAGLATDSSVSVYCLPYRYSKALVKLMLLSYSTMLSTTLQMLHCVRVEGVTHPMRLYLAPDSVRCYEPMWQKLLFVLLFSVLLPFPLLLWQWRQWLQSRMRESLVQGSTFEASLAALHVIQGPFRTVHPITASWECIILLRRLVIASAAMFLETQPFWRAVVLAAANIVALCCHIAYQPLRDLQMQRLETISLSLLVALSLLKWHEAIFTELSPGSVQPYCHCCHASWHGGSPHVYRYLWTIFADETRDYEACNCSRAPSIAGNMGVAI
jgi:hypothetical protein